MRRIASLLLSGALLAGALSAGLLSGCASEGAADGAPRAAARPMTPMRFRRMRAMLDEAAREAGRGDVAALRRRSPTLSTEGLALIQAVLPHDVARQDVPRYIEGRARFGEALKDWVTVVASGTDAEVIQALRRLDDATRGWVDAYLGLAPETSI